MRVITRLKERLSELVKLMDICVLPSLTKAAIKLRKKIEVTIKGQIV